MGRLLAMQSWVEGRQWPAKATGSRYRGGSIQTVREQLPARLAAGRCPFKLLHATFDLVQTLVGLLRGLVGGLRALRSTLHLYVELIETRVDGCKLVLVRGAGAKADGGDERYSKCAGRLHVLRVQVHCTPSFVWGSWNIAAFVPVATKRFQLEFEYVDAL